MMDLKAGVDLRGARPELAIGLLVMEGVFRDHGVPMTVTAITNGTHMKGSLHYAGLAVDIRLASRYTTAAESDRRIQADMKQRLGPQWDVLLETDHFHVEWDPKQPEVARNA